MIDGANGMTDYLANTVAVQDMDLAAQVKTLVMNSAMSCSTVPTRRRRGSIAGSVRSRPSPSH